MATATYTAFGTVSGGGTPTGTYTFSTLAIGSANAARIVLVGAVWRSGANFSSATIGGVSATLLDEYENPSGGTTIAWFYAAVPTGTTATVVVNIAATGNRMAVVVYTTTDSMNWAGAQFGRDAIGITGGSSPQVTNPNANTTSNGFACGLAAFASVGSSLALAWTGLSENDEQTVDTLRFAAASLSNTSANTPLSISVTYTVTGTINDPTSSVVSVPVAAAATVPLRSLMGVGT